MQQHPIEVLEAHLFNVLGHVSTEEAEDNLKKAIAIIGKLKDERNQHNHLIIVCSPLVKEEDGSDLTPNWYRVHNALTRLVSERNDYKRELNRMIDAYRGQVTRFGSYGEEIDAALMTVKKHEPQ